MSNLIKNKKVEQLFKVILSVVIFCYSLFMLIRYIKGIFFQKKDIYYFQEFTLETESVIVIFFLLYFSGSIIYLVYRKGGLLLMAASLGFIIGGIVDLLFNQSYRSEVYLPYILLNGLVFILFKNANVKSNVVILLFVFLLAIIISAQLFNFNVIIS